jgi:putative heme transporter
VPAKLVTVTGWTACLIVLGVGAYLLAQFLMQVRVLVVAMVASLLMAALLAPVTQVLRKAKLPPVLAAAGALLVLLAGVAAALTLVSMRFSAQIPQLRQTLTSGVRHVRDYLVNGPLSLSANQVDQVQHALVATVQSTVPAPLSGAAAVLNGLATVVLALAFLFLLLKNGPSTWRWLVERSAPDSRPRVDAAGRAAWDTVTSYIRGVVLVALIDATGIGVALVVLDVPLALSLALLTFLGAFIPIIGATVVGAMTVLVALATEGPVTALIVLGAVLLIQQLEGNVFYPWIMGNALRLAPLVVLVAVTAGWLLAGVLGAVIAVPLVAAGYRAVLTIRQPHPVG